VLGHHAGDRGADRHPARQARGGPGERLGQGAVRREVVEHRVGVDERRRDRAAGEQQQPAERQRADGERERRVRGAPGDEQRRQPPRRVARRAGAGHREAREQRAETPQPEHQARQPLVPERLERGRDGDLDRPDREPEQREHRDEDAHAGTAQGAERMALGDLGRPPARRGGVQREQHVAGEHEAGAGEDRGLQRPRADAADDRDRAEDVDDLHRRALERVGGVAEVGVRREDRPQRAHAGADGRLGRARDRRAAHQRGHPGVAGQ
jgi:hypothetical protein